MALFEYLRQDRRGGPYQRRRIVSENQSAAERQLLARQVPVLDLQPVDARPWYARVFGVFGKPEIPLQVKLTFAEQVRAAQNIEMPLLETLNLCREATVHKKFRAVLSEMIRRVTEGSSFYDAMRLSGAFDSLTLGLVRAGEQSGRLGETFDQIKTIYRRNEIVRKKVVGLMVYPAIVFSLAVFAVFFLMWFTVPQFIGIFAGTGIELPWPTQFLISVSRFVTRYPWLIVMGIFCAVVLMLRLPALYRAFPAVHGAVLKLPLVGALQKKLIQETFTRTFVSLLKAELKYMEALQLCRSISTNFVYRGAIARAVVSVSLGNTLMTALEGNRDILGLLLVRSLGFGEKTGRLEEVLQPLAEMLGFEIGEQIEQLKNYIQPAATVIIGGVVLMIMLALFLPVFNLPRLISAKAP